MNHLKSITFALFALIIFTNQAFTQGAWTTKSPLPSVRSQTVGGVVNGIFYLIGGTNIIGNSIDTVLAYNPSTNSWSFKTLTPRTFNGGYGIVVIDTLIFKVGGATSISTTDTLETYNPSANSWSTKTPMPTARHSMGVAVDTNAILYAIGGATTGAYQFPTDAVEAYNPITDTWDTTHTPLPSRRSTNTSVAINGIIYSVGGRDSSGQALNIVQAYNPITKIWSTKAPLQTPRFYHRSEVIGGQIYVVGGYTNGDVVLNSVEKYDPILNTWSFVSPLPSPRYLPGTCVIDSLLYVAGGCDNTSWGTSTLFVYNPFPAVHAATVSVPAQMSAEAGDTISVPVNVSGIAKSDSVLSFQFKLAYDDSVIHFIGFDTSGLGMGSFSIMDTPVVKLLALDTLKVAASSTTPADSGIFMILKFKVDTNSSLGSTSVLKIVTFTLNEGIPSVTDTISGIFKNQRAILFGDVNENGSISGADASLILQHVIDIISLDSLHRKIADVSGNGQVFAYDAALILRWLVGFIPTFPVGTSFLYPKTGEPSIVPKGNLALIRDNDGKDGVTYVLRLTGAEDVISGQWQIRYDPERLKFRNARVSEWNKDFILQTKDDRGILSIAIAGAAPLKGDGVLLILYFDGNPEEQFEVSVLQAILNETVQFSIATESGVPRVFGLSQNYPNPFNPVTQIKYQLPRDTHVSLVIYNVLGQRVRTLINKVQSAGYYTVQWDSKDDTGRLLASGVYFYRIKAGDFLKTRKMLLIK